MAHAARYSGPGRTGVCVCGHAWDDHHLGMIMREEYLRPRSNGVVEAYLPQECEVDQFEGMVREGGCDCQGYRDSAQGL